MTTIKTDIDQIALDIAEMSRDAVKYELLHFQGSFDIDFTEDYLERLPLERLRHILLAAKIQQKSSN